MKKTLLLKTMLLLCALIVGSSSAWAQTTYKLTSVTSVSAGNKYVFVRNSRALSNSVSSSKLQTTEFSTTALSGTENYVWTLETATNGFYLKNASLASNQYVNNTSSGSISFGNKNSIWSIDFTNDVALISNKSNSNRFIGETTSGSKEYKTYASSNLSSYGHDFTVYVLEEEAATSVATPSFSPVGGTYTSTQNVELSCETTGADIYYTLDGTTPSSSSTKYTTAISVSETKIIKAIAIKGSDASNVATATYTIYPVTHAGTAEDPYTVIDARNALTAGIIGAETDYYVKGYISQIGTLSNEGQLTYWLSDDGSMTSTIQCYKGKFIDGADFEDETDLEVGDFATVKGKLKIYGTSTYEFDENNEVVSISTRTKVNISTFTATTPTIVIGESTETTVTNDQAGWTPVSYTYESDDTDIATVDANGVVTAVAKGTANITVTANVAADDANYKTGESKSVEITVTNPFHNVIFSVNGVAGDPTSTEESAAVSFPANPADLGGKKFVGWTATAIDGTTDEAPTFVTSATMGTSDQTYYAVFANVSSGGSSDTYALVSDADNLSNGDKIILVSTGQYTASKVTYNFTVANGTVNDSKLMDPVDVTISDNKVTSTDVAPITLVAVTGGWKLQMGTQYLNIVPTKNNIVLDDDGAINSISIASDEATIGEITDGNDTRNLVYNPNSGNGRFAYYKSAQKAVMIFKQEIGETYSAYCTSITVPVTISANKEWITFCSTANLDFSEAIEGLKGAYTITAHESQAITLTATKMTGTVKAGTGLLLRAAAVDATNPQVITIPVATTGEEQADNMLKGVTVDTEVQPTAGDYTNLGLSNGEFHPYSAAGTLAAGKAYLQIPTAQMPTGGNNARLYIVLDGEATGIANVDVNANDNFDNAPMYNLAGQRVTKSYKGVVIVNGKKYINK